MYQKINCGLLVFCTILILWACRFRIQESEAKAGDSQTKKIMCTGMCVCEEGQSSGRTISIKIGSALAVGPSAKESLDTLKSKCATFLTNVRCSGTKLSTVRQLTLFYINLEQNEGGNGSGNYVDWDSPTKMSLVPKFNLEI